MAKEKKEKKEKTEEVMEVEEAKPKKEKKEKKRKAEAEEDVRPLTLTCCGLHALGLVVHRTLHGSWRRWTLPLARSVSDLVCLWRAQTPKKEKKAKKEKKEESPEAEEETPKVRSRLTF